jgi:hypothetical protein
MLFHGYAVGMAFARGPSMFAMFVVHPAAPITSAHAADRRPNRVQRPPIVPDPISLIALLVRG